MQRRAQNVDVVLVHDALAEARSAGADVGEARHEHAGLAAEVPVVLLGHEQLGPVSHAGPHAALEVAGVLGVEPLALLVLVDDLGPKEQHVEPVALAAPQQLRQRPVGEVVVRVQEVQVLAARDVDAVVPRGARPGVLLVLDDEAPAEHIGVALARGQRPVGRPVVDDHHLVVGGVEPLAQDGAKAVRHEALCIKHGDDNGETNHRDLASYH